MTINDEILILANKIANKGNKPTVALIKTKLSKKVPLPVLISTLKGWQHDPSFTKLPQEKIKTNKPDDSRIKSESFEQDLHVELAIMKNEILELKQLVKQLIKQQKN